MVSATEQRICIDGGLNRALNPHRAIKLQVAEGDKNDIFRVQLRIASLALVNLVQGNFNIERSLEDSLTMRTCLSEACLRGIPASATAFSSWEKYCSPKEMRPAW